MPKTKKTPRFKILQRDRFCCFYCGVRASDSVVLQIDHVLPVTGGGDDNAGNTVAACAACNAGKFSRPLAPNVAVEVLREVARRNMAEGIDAEKSVRLNGARASARNGRARQKPLEMTPHAIAGRAAYRLYRDNGGSIAVATLAYARAYLAVQRGECEKSEPTIESVFRAVKEIYAETGSPIKNSDIRTRLKKPSGTVLHSLKRLTQEKKLLRFGVLRHTRYTPAMDDSQK